jgi:hypothetical protein
MSKVANTSANNKRRREDPTVSELRYDWQLFISKIIQVGSGCKADVNNPRVQADIKTRSQDFAESHDKLKNLVGKMESVVRGKEEEMRGLVQARMSTGSVGKRRRKVRSNPTETAPAIPTDRQGGALQTNSVPVQNVAANVQTSEAPAPPGDDIIVIS